MFQEGSSDLYSESDRNLWLSSIQMNVLQYVIAYANLVTTRVIINSGLWKGIWQNRKKIYTADIKQG